MKNLNRRMDHREQVLATALSKPGSANKLRDRLSTDTASQLSLEHIRIILWCHFLEDLTDESFDVVSILDKGEKAIFDEAAAIILGDIGWDYRRDK